MPLCARLPALPRHSIGLRQVVGRKGSPSTFFLTFTLGSMEPVMASVGKHCQGPLGAYGLAHSSQFPAMHLCLSLESVGVQ